MNGYLTKGGPSLWLFWSVYMERRRQKNWGGKRRWVIPIILFESQDLVMSKLRSMVPNLSERGQMSQTEILMGQTFKKKFMKIVILLTSCSTLYILEETKHVNHKPTYNRDICWQTYRKITTCIWKVGFW